MAEERHCTKCGGELPADAPQGLCPQCLMKLGLPSGAEAEKPATPDDRGAIPTSATPPGGFVPPEPAELAEKFPQLEILELLGQGGMGAVYKARQKQLDRLVALKILPPEVGQTEAFAERFTREARSMAKLHHPRIVTVFDFGQTEDGLYYFIMEFVDGTDLRHVIQAGELSPDEALAIVPQICEALQFAHTKGIVHRDIKPENILLDKEGNIKIADFGLVRLLDRPGAAYTLTQAGQRMGTPHYMAPEQIEHPSKVDHRADIYSLGVVFYEMLTGELPLGRFAPPSQKVQVDVRLDEIVLHTLEKEPELRYQQASEVKTDVETVVSSEQQASQPSSPYPPYQIYLDRFFGFWSRPQPGFGKQVGIPILILLGVWMVAFFAAEEEKVVSLVGQSAYLLFPVAFSLLTLRWAVRREKARKAEQEQRSGMKPSDYLTPQTDQQGSEVKTDVETIATKGQLHGVTREVAVSSPTAVRRPSMGLLVVGILNWLFMLLWVLFALTLRAHVRQIELDPPTGGYLMPWVPVLGHMSPATITLIALVMAGTGVFLIFAAIRMKRLQFESGAIAASILAMLIPPASLLGLPIGIWVLSVLGKPEVKAAFAQNREGKEKTVAQQCVSGPAIGLLVAALIFLASGLITALVIMAQTRVIDSWEAGELRLETTLFLLPMALAVLAPVLLIPAALKLRQLRFRGLVVAAGVLCLIPLTPGWLITLPIGIWVLSVLAKAEVKAAFPGGRRHAEANGGIRESSIKTAGDGLIVIAGVALLVAAGVGLWLKIAGAKWDWPPSSRQSSLHGTLAAMAVMSTVYALFIGAAGILMRRVRGRLFALLSVVIAGVFVPAVLALNVIMEHDNMGDEWMVLIPLWLGMPICLWLAAALFRRDTRVAFENAAQPDVEAAAALESERRFSRPAIVGACCVPLAILLFVPPMVLTDPKPLRSSEFFTMMRETTGGFVLVILFALVGLAASFATTILGMVSITHIRQSAGRACGMGLALFDALLFPVLALNIAIIAVFLLTGMAIPEALILALIIGGPLDFFLIRGAWRKANASLEPPQSQADQTPRPGTAPQARTTKKLQQPDKPRICKLPVIGALWAPFGLVMLSFIFIVHSAYYMEEGAQAAALPGRTVLQWVLLFTVLPLGALAPFVSTTLGCLGISKIRSSQGQLIGMPLAVAVALFYPILVLDGILLFIAARLGDTYNCLMICVAVTALVILALDFFIIRALWKAVTKSADGTKEALGSEQTDVEPIENQSKPEAVDATQAIRQQVRGAATGMLLAGLINLVLSPITGLWLLVEYRLIDHWEVGDWSATTTTLTSVVIAQVVAIPIAALVIAAALNMRRLHIYGLAVAGAVLLLLPLSPGSLLGLAMGIWALVVLSNKEVKAAFPQGTVDLSRQGKWNGFCMAALLISLVGGLMSIREIDPGDEVRDRIIWAAAIVLSSVFASIGLWQHAKCRGMHGKNLGIGIAALVIALAALVGFFVTIWYPVSW